jgi:hypothetical protein
MSADQDNAAVNQHHLQKNFERRQKLARGQAKLSGTHIRFICLPPTLLGVGHMKTVFI